MSKLYLTTLQLNNIFNDPQEPLSNLSNLHSSPISYNELVTLEKQQADEERIQLKSKIHYLQEENKHLKYELSQQINNDTGHLFCKFHDKGFSQTQEHITGFYPDRSTVKTIENKTQNVSIQTGSHESHKEHQNTLQKENDSLKKHNERLQQQIQSVKDTLQQFSHLNNLLVYELQQIKNQKQVDKSKTPKVNLTSYSIMAKQQIPKKIVTYRPSHQSFQNDKQIIVEHLNGKFHTSHSFQMMSPSRAITPSPIINKIFHKNLSIISSNDLMIFSPFYNSK